MPELSLIRTGTIQVTEPEAQTAQFIELTADIAAAYVSNNTVAASELPSLIKGIFGALANADGPAPAEPQQPAVSVKKSLTPDYLICLEDGRRFKSLRRHLRAKFGLTPEAYRAKWGLPKDYPMVAPAYSEARSNLAKRYGLGQGGRAAAALRTRSNAVETARRPKA
jgi:predicted transcriptional regulator